MYLFPYHDTGYLLGMYLLGQLTLSWGEETYRPYLVEIDDEVIVLKADTYIEPLLLDVADLLREPKPWEQNALRVHRERMYFGLAIAEEERVRFRNVYLMRRNIVHERLRPSLLTG